MKADETTANRVPFVFDQSFRPDGEEVISQAFEHGFKQKRNRGTENNIGLEEKKNQQPQ